MVGTSSAFRHADVCSDCERLKFTGHSDHDVRLVLFEADVDDEVDGVADFGA